MNSQQPHFGSKKSSILLTFQLRLQQWICSVLWKKFELIDLPFTTSLSPKKKWCQNKTLDSAPQNVNGHHKRCASYWEQVVWVPVVHCIRPTTLSHSHPKWLALHQKMANLQSLQGFEVFNGFFAPKMWWVFWLKFFKIHTQNSVVETDCKQKQRLVVGVFKGSSFDLRN